MVTATHPGGALSLVLSSIRRSQYKRSLAPIHIPTRIDWLCSLSVSYPSRSQRTAILVTARRPNERSLGNSDTTNTVLQKLLQERKQRCVDSRTGDPSLFLWTPFATRHFEAEPYKRPAFLTRQRLDKNHMQFHAKLPIQQRDTTW